MSNFIGIDLTASPKKKTALAVLDSKLQVISLIKIASDEEILSTIDSFSPAIVGIDSPLTLPLGWHCLEASHGCQPASVLKGRECERAMAKMEIPSYFVTTRCIIRDMVYRGINLRTSLENKDHTVIEVYPYGSKVQLFGKPIPSKLKLLGLAFLREKVGTIVPQIGPQANSLDHDLCDALIAAYTVYLHWNGQTFPVGDPHEGLVYLPNRRS